MGKIEFMAKMSTPHLFFDNSNTARRTAVSDVRRYEGLCAAYGQLELLH